MADPTPADLKAAFPAFAAVPDATVQIVLDDAILRIDTSWTDSSIPYAQMLYACHLLVMSGLGDSPEAKAIAAGAGILKEQKAGGSEVIFNIKPGELGTLRSTSFGRMLLEIRQMSVRNSGPTVLGVDDPCANSPYDGTIYPSWPGIWPIF